MAKVVNIVVFALGEDVKIGSGDFYSSFYADTKVGVKIRLDYCVTLKT